jgi:PII-like signaling protein
MMLTIGPARKVTIYVGDAAQHGGEPLYVTILNYLFSHRVAGATATRGLAGFGAEHHMHTARILEMSQSLPVKIEFVESIGAVEQLLPGLLDIVRDGLVEMQDTTIVKATAPSGRASG